MLFLSSDGVDFVTSHRFVIPLGDIVMTVHGLYIEILIAYNVASSRQKFSLNMKELGLNQHCHISPRNTAIKRRKLN